MSTDTGAALDRDIARIAEQEARLRWPRFDLDDAWRLGSALRDAARARGLALTIEVRLAQHTVFFHAMPGTTPANADWARRKRNVVELVHRSSYGVGRSDERDGRTLHQRMALDPRDHATAGGSFPITVDGVGVVGTATVSGAPQREDHELLVATIATLLGLPAAELALDR